jgi:hypothetical protein
MPLGHISNMELDKRQIEEAATMAETLEVTARTKHASTPRWR